ncbi:MAG: barstar family protein [Nocardioides sp.]
MSGLAGLLAGRTPPVTYRWHGALDVTDVRRAVEHAGWHLAHHDGWTEETKAEFLAGIGATLDFPGHYGRNFDALADCLGDLTADTVLLWDGWGPFARADERAFSVALTVLGGRVHAERGGRFAVLLRGAGPDLPDVPSLD